jgi:Haem-binding domain
MGRTIKWLFLILFLAFIGIQFIGVGKSNPPVTAEISAPANIKNILRASCYDCHSNETVWPWYSKIAPVSWFIANDVNSGRKHLNFSDWEKYADAKKEKKLKDIWNQVNEGEMPLRAYTFLHPGAELELDERNTIKKWITGKGILE